ncbi:MAG TPA: VWA domain-containing protein [Planctomycetaceae bacterium]|nr:VWA domain-containing protein [Planctomycetaceae bacterium]
MSIEIKHPELLSAAWPTMVVVLLLLVAIMVWVAAHRLRHRWQLNRILASVFMVARVGIGYVTLWLTCSLLSRWIVFATSWSLWGVCLGTAAAVEAVLMLYQLERQTVTRRTGLSLVCLRSAMVLLVALMIVQPMIVWEREQVDERIIAILVDESASMDIQDDQLTNSEQIRLAHMFNPDLAKRPYDLDGVVTQLGRTINRLNLESASIIRLQNLPQADLEKGFELRAEPLRQTTKQMLTSLAEQKKRLNAVLNADLQLAEDTRATTGALRDRIANLAIGQLLDCQKEISDSQKDTASRLRVIVERLQGVATELRAVNQEMVALVKTVDKKFLESLSPEDVQEIQRVASRTRTRIATAMLLGKDGVKESLLRKFRDGYTVKVYGFDSQVTEMTEKQLRIITAKLDAASVLEKSNGQDLARPATDGATGEDQVPNVPAQQVHQRHRLATDVVAALETVRKQIPQEKLAGVLLVSDGRHNASGDLGTVAREFANRQIPVSAIVIGSSKAPVDAAIVGLESPSTLLVEDQLRVKARVKVTGMKGRKVRLVMSHGEEQIAKRIIDIDQDEFVGIVELHDIPKVAGFRKYHVQIAPEGNDQGPSDSFADNNMRDITVAVTDQRTQVLIVEDRPRWEFRYLRNLLAERDKTVRLQTVLLAPDRLASIKERPKVPASVTRPDGDHEATSLPENEQEWMKFDVIILGDVSAQQLDTESIQIIHDFVDKRAGTLIVIAGPRHLPHQFVDTPLEELFPVTFNPTTEAMVAPPEPSFRWVLTQAGRQNSVTRQADTTEENTRIWNELPDLYWRYPITGTKKGAEVLAYASTEQMEKELAAPNQESDEQASQRRKKREQLEHQNALLTTHRYGDGRVMMITSDRTWRLRYRVGDTYHHRFWGQVLRWAETGKLQAGTSMVRMGTDRIIYGDGDPVTVTVRITDAKLEPILDQEAQLKVYQGEQLVLTKQLQSLPNRNGMYRVELNRLPGPGTFRLILDSPLAAEVLAVEGEEAVETEITVLSPQVNSRELLEPTADREALAYLTHLSGGNVVEADQATDVLGFFGTGTHRYTEQTRQTLWDTWPLLVVMVLLLTVEWVIRKRGGLI